MIASGATASTFGHRTRSQRPGGKSYSRWLGDISGARAGWWGDCREGVTVGGAHESLAIDGPASRFVGRGGEKLQAALDEVARSARER